ncbi:MAG: hypothetical protein OIF58_11195 [Cohaesibacter sp.]|nr:hypothetical protein [Cohaesibacter sp.]
MTGAPDSIQLTFDAIGFGPEVVDGVHVIRPFGKSNKKARTCTADPFGLLALRAQRQMELRRTYGLGEYASAALEVVPMPEGKAFRHFAYCVIAGYAVANRYFLKPSEMFGAGRDQVELSGARHIVQNLAIEIGGCPTTMVGRVFGRHHATVGHAVQSVNSLRLMSPSLEAEMDNLERAILDWWAVAEDGEGLRRRIAVIA